MDLSKKTQCGPRWKGEKLKRIDKPESDLQSYCENFLKIAGFKYIHIPSAAYKDRRAAHILSGIPDLIILFPWGKYLLIELKTKSKIRQCQRKWKESGHFNDGIYHIVQKESQFNDLMLKYGR